MSTLTENEKQCAEEAKLIAGRILDDTLRKLHSAHWRNSKIISEKLLQELINELQKVSFLKDSTAGKLHAYVYPDSTSRVIYLCPHFWRAPKHLEPYSQPGTIIHEVSHFLGYEDFTENTKEVFKMPRVLLHLEEDHQISAHSIDFAFEVTLNHKTAFVNGLYSCCGERARDSVCQFSGS